MGIKPLNFVNELLCKLPKRTLYRSEGIYIVACSFHRLVLISENEKPKNEFRNRLKCFLTRQIFWDKLTHCVYYIGTVWWASFVVVGAKILFRVPTTYFSQTFWWKITGAMALLLTNAFFILRFLEVCQAIAGFSK